MVRQKMHLLIAKFFLRAHDLAAAKKEIEGGLSITNGRAVCAGAYFVERSNLIPDMVMDGAFYRPGLTFAVVKFTCDQDSRQSWLTARVPGARPLDPMGYDESDLPADRDCTLVFYCSNFMCRKASNAARRAKDMGYRNVYVMSAGISGWVGASLPTESGEKRDT
jgi:rhodanese-related sulfurtransferase